MSLATRAFQAVAADVRLCRSVVLRCGGFCPLTPRVACPQTTRLPAWTWSLCSPPAAGRSTQPRAWQTWRPSWSHHTGVAGQKQASLPSVMTWQSIGMRALVPATKASWQRCRRHGQLPGCHLSQSTPCRRRRPSAARCRPRIRAAWRQTRGLQPMAWRLRGMRGALHRTAHCWLTAPTAPHRTTMAAMAVGRRRQRGATTPSRLGGHSTDCTVRALAHAASPHCQMHTHR